MINKYNYKNFQSKGWAKNNKTFQTVLHVIYGEGDGYYTNTHIFTDKNNYYDLKIENCKDWQDNYKNKKICVIKNVEKALNKLMFLTNKNTIYSIFGNEYFTESESN